MQGKTDLSIYTTGDYQPGGLLKRLIWYCINFLFFINPLCLSSGLKRFLLRIFGAKVGNGVVIKPNVNIKYPWNLKIGNHVWIGEGVWIDNLGEVALGSHVCLSQGALLLSGNHDYKSTTFNLMVGKIKLEDGVWIGARAVVCQGVICYSHAFLTTGSIATSDLEAYGIYQGNPAKKIKDRTIQ
jgi:putative colanic acid biosynthesis acetyltransferase WcaF